MPIEAHIRHINKLKEHFWITFAERIIGEWQEDCNSCQIIEIPGEPLNMDCPYLNVLPYQNTLIILSGLEDRFWQVDLSTGTWKDLRGEFPSEFFREVESNVLFCGYHVTERNVCRLYPRAGNGTLAYDMENNSFLFRSINYTQKDLYDIHKNWVILVWNVHSLLWESFMSVGDYVIGVSSGVNGEIKYHENENIGKKIFEVMLVDKRQRL